MVQERPETKLHATKRFRLKILPTRILDPVLHNLKTTLNWIRNVTIVEIIWVHVTFVPYTFP